jgi:hypothetical protein
MKNLKLSQRRHYATFLVTFQEILKIPQYRIPRTVTLTILNLWVLAKGRERNPPPCSRHLGQVVKGCVTPWRQSCLTPPPSPSLLANWEIADRHPNQTICQHETLAMY